MDGASETDERLYDQQDSRLEPGEDARWVSFAELAAVRGISNAHAGKLVRRAGWRRKTTPDKRVLILVPTTEMAPASCEAGLPSERPRSDQDGTDASLSLRDLARMLTAVERMLAALRERATAADKRAEEAAERAKAAEASAERAEARARAAETGRNAALADLAAALAERRHADC